MNITRAVLHEAIWSAPVMHVAAVLGLSDTALARLCVQCEIPTPPRGYWTKHQAGLAPAHQVPLKGDASAIVPVEVEVDVYARLNGLRAKYGAALTHVDSPTESSRADCAAARLKPDATFATSEAIARMSYATGSDPFEPAWPQLLELISRQHAFNMLNELADSACQRAFCEDPATCAVTTLWVQRAKAAAQAQDPSAGLVEYCQRIAQGLLQPAWWRAIQGEHLAKNVESSQPANHEKPLQRP